MADIFSTENVRNLLHEKFIFLLGDSNMRAMYKDLVLLISRNELSTVSILGAKGIESFEGDRRIGFSGLTKGRYYEESREFLKHDTHVEYHFITRCYTPQIVNFFTKIKSGQMKTPDVVVMNSCVWDITRWGPNGVDAYKENMQKLITLLRECLPPTTLFIWTTSLPLSTQVKGGLLIKQLGFMQSLLRFEVMEANLFCRQLIVQNGFDVLDMHYHLRMQAHRRMNDGIHYGPWPIRYVTNLLLTHISLSWNIPLPGNWKGIALERIIKNGVLHTSKKENVKFPVVPASLRATTKDNEKEQRNSKKKFQRKAFKGKKEQTTPPVWQEEPEIWTNYGWTQAKTQPLRTNYQKNYWNDQREFGQSNYANFDQVPGPVRRNIKFKPNNRPRPY